MLGYDFPLLSLFWISLWWFFLFSVFFAIVWCFIDNFRRHDHGGGAKAGWTIVLLLFPFVGMIIYMIARPADALATT